ncbi:AEC family transporter [Saccharospirillum alexandrii]|uniref:AEC family transporter n=1 Tax=Saccharospirillum alexandrii TaxID=2448477 RepID=UPI000FD7D146|nr:AEC family transporter [Saccharospirillum alexandrii]
MIANALGPVFLLILLGVALRHWDLPPAATWPGIERLTYTVLFPALLVHRLALADFDLRTFGQLALTLCSALLVISLLFFLLQRWLAKDGPDLTSVYQGAVRFNTYIGLAVVSALHGEPGLVIAAMAMAVMIPFVNVLCVLTFALTGTGSQVSARGIVRALLSNPLILGCLAGVALNVSGIGLPGWTADTARLLGSTALPLGLLAVGAALNLRTLSADVKPVLLASLVKFALLPLALVALATLFGVNALGVSVLLILGTLPTASSAFILARQMGGNANLMANIITLQTLMAFLVMPAWLVLAANTALF